MWRHAEPIAMDSLIFAARDWLFYQAFQPR
jgi:hypothetical protein